MRVLIAFAVASTLAAASPVMAKGRAATIHVKAHTTKAGTYVPAHVRTAPNRTKADNWSSKGNVNPYTGKAGTKDPNQPQG